MGGKGSKDASGKKSKVPAKPPSKLSDKDVKFFMQKTGMTKEQINSFFQKFNKDNPDGKLDRKEFMQLYPTLRSEPVDNLDEITNMIFRAFDSDNNGYLTFNEFLIGYALTSKGDLKQKLEYAFELYDADNNGYLTSTEINEVVVGMLDLLDADRKNTDAKQLTSEIVKQLDTSNDGKISKDEFVNGLLKNYSLRSLMNPFG